ncbi:MAG TPA: proton-conducting transporter membrane subunit, partial [Flavisolibacter sp.]|nr:proton-conducting transporter membrane subunit [Flavisolibacter sp.]
IGGLGMFTVAALSGAVFYLIHDIIIKTNLFLVGGLVYKINGELNMKRMGGIYASYPGLSLLIAVPLFSLVGVPPLSGFWPKINLFAESFATANYFLLGSLIFGSVITLFVITRFWSEAFWKKADNPVRRPYIRYYDQMPRKQKWLLIAPILFLSLISLYIGLGAENIFRLSNTIATELVDTSAYIDAVLGLTKNGTP